ncbi:MULTISPECIES: hypothetical protein [Halanaerobium]|uniref:Membrane protein YesL n=1 Tax=Halanaerobium kushneri TaxID=56779 RepID=A0A1N6U8V0_9FIRM|nr:MULTISPECIES: hypothetical protein [Halanaerobium]PUU91653.1 MAG: hypothetical protein CI947_1178 [Halanaerobium sp.]PUU95228.1 MAG: hypothetical protein CI949_228 [Halanaerobium sp.]RCW60231.1 hypothetical protein DFR80_10880 [Halanaerobium sp. ST460_2HS_T2]SIQ61941.1 hypothetical protein SAMN05421834_10678 [Halanaerobium kushneri]
MEIFSILKSTFKDFYEDLFKLVLLSVAWFVISSVLLFAVFIGLTSGWYLILLLPLVFLGPVFLTSLYGTSQILEEGSIALKALFSYFKNNFWRGFLVFLISVILYIIFVVDLRFFLLKGQENIWLLAFAFLFAYLLIYFSIYQAYLWGLLIIQGERPLKDIFKNAVILSLDNIIFSLLWFLAIFLISVILFVTGIGLPAGFIGIIGILILQGTKEMLAKY